MQGSSLRRSVTVPQEAYSLAKTLMSNDSGKGIVRSLDSVGRIMIPIEVRRELGVAVGDKVSIIVEKDRVIIEKYRDTCYLCGKSAKNFNYVNNKRVCFACLDHLNGK